MIKIIKKDMETDNQLSEVIIEIPDSKEEKLNLSSKPLQTIVARQANLLVKLSVDELSMISRFLTKRDAIQLSKTCKRFGLFKPFFAPNNLEKVVPELKAANIALLEIKKERFRRQKSRAHGCFIMGIFFILAIGTFTMCLGMLEISSNINKNYSLVTGLILILLDIFISIAAVALATTALPLNIEDCGKLFLPCLWDKELAREKKNHFANTTFHLSEVMNLNQELYLATKAFVIGNDIRINNIPAHEASLNELITLLSDTKKIKSNYLNSEFNENVLRTRLSM